jgi:hypothetical protein
MVRVQSNAALSVALLDMLVWCAAVGTNTLECAATQLQGRALSSYTGSSIADAPAAAGSSSISLKVSGDGNNVAVDVKAGKASAKASYPANSIRQ